MRPTTRDLTVYYHNRNGTAALRHIEARAKLVEHERELLRDKIVIDAPDFDSTAHWKIPITRHPKGVSVQDVNGDGLNDVVLHHRGTLGLVIARKR